MRRLLASLLLGSLIWITALSQGEAAAPPVSGSSITVRSSPAGDLFPGGVPKTLADLQVLENRVKEVLERITPATVNLGGGSGVIINKEGLILTVAHVGSKAGRDITVTFPDGKRVKGKTLGNFRTLDAGLARITEKGDWPFVDMAKSENIKPGQWCMVLGYPVSFTRGMKPPVRLGRVLRTTSSTIMTDCPMMGGDSGGPLFDLEGRVIGLNSRVSNAITGNIHVPIDVYHTNWKRMMDGEDWGNPIGRPRTPPKGKEKSKEKKSSDETYQLVQRQRPDGGPRGSGRGSNLFERNADLIRAAFKEAVEPLAQSTVRLLAEGKPVALGTVVTDTGLLVSKASQLKGKITCRLPDGTTVDVEKIGEDKDHDLAVLRVKAKGLKAVRWKIGDAPQRGSLVAAAGEKGQAMAVGTVTVEPRQFRVTTGTRRPGTAPAPTRGFLGLSAEEGDKIGLKAFQVLSGGPAEKAGVKVGDIIRKLGEKEIRTLAELRDVLGKHKVGDKLDLIIKRGEKEEKLNVTLGRVPATLTQAPYDRWGGGPFSERRFDFPKVLAHDTVVLPNDCGGPLVDTTGQVVGVVISRSLRVATYALLPADVEKIVKKVTTPVDSTKGKTP